MRPEREKISRVQTGIVAAVLGALLGLVSCLTFGAFSVPPIPPVLQCLAGGAFLGLVLGLTVGRSAIGFLWQVMTNL